MKWAIILPILLLSTAASFAQTAATPRGPADAAADLPPPKNIDRTLDDKISIDAEKMPLAEFIAKLRDQTQTNIFVNWNSVAQTGLARDTPITLHLKNLPYEQVVKTLIEVLPAEKSHANYQVGDNTLEITTNAALGKGSTYRLYPIARVTSYSLGAAGAGAASPGDPANEKLIAQVLQAELLRAGEPLESGSHTLAIRGGTLAASVSERGQNILDRALTMLDTPIRPGQFAPGTSVTASAKRAQDALIKAAGPLSPATFLTLAKDPAKYAPTLNLALLPGTDAELLNPTPALDGTITDGGIILIGPTTALAQRTLFAAYDLRDVIKRRITNSGLRNKGNGVQMTPASAAFQQTNIVDSLKSIITPADWGAPTDLGKRPSIMIPYQGLLLVFATADQHRAITATLQEIMK